nr:scyllo-inositol 2-dehydrogenase (NAD(+)) [Cupriavidus sp.]
MVTSYKTRCAVIGVGYLGRFHAQKYAASDKADLVGVCDPNKDRAEQIAAEMGCRAFTDPIELVGLVDAVSIAAPTQQHFSLSRFALNHGMHVLVEKPITVRVSEAEEIDALARSKGLVLQVGHLERFNPAVTALMQTPVQPRFIESHRLAPFKTRGADVNVVLDLMIHDVDIVLCLNQSPVNFIAASGACVISGEIDIANARLEFDNGCVANITASRVSGKSERMLRVFSDGVYTALDLQERRLRRHRVSSHKDANGMPTIENDTLELPAADALALEVDAFLLSIQTGSPVAVSGQDGAEALRAAARITELIGLGIKRL